MTVTPAVLLRGVALLVMIVAWAVLAHLGSAGTGNADLSAAIATAPLAILALVLLWRVRHPLWLATGGLAVVGLLAWTWPSLRQNVALLYYVQHLGTHLALGTLFGRTLFGPQEPLVAQFARVAHGGVLSVQQQHYTRQVTVAWTLFFAASAGVSSLLFWLAPAHAWSVFANLLNTPLIVVMFIGELIIRRRVLPAEECAGIVDTVRAYRASMQERRAHRLANHP